MATARLQQFGSLGLRGFIILASMWTFFSIFMLLAKVLSTSADQELFLPTESTVVLPVVSPTLLLRDTPVIENALAKLRAADRGRRQHADAPVRFGIVFQNDSTSFVELTFVSECACPASKVDRYEITREIFDPLSGQLLTRLKDENLSAEGVTQYLGVPLTKWRNE